MITERKIANTQQLSGKPKRSVGVDIAKGIGIILVVWGHNKCPVGLEIFAFHMPLFFIISGFFLKDESIKDFLYKKYRTLLVPCFFFWSLFFCIGTPLLYFRSKDLFFERLSDKTLFYFITVDSSLWFLVALWWSLVSAFLIIHYIKPCKWWWRIVLVTGLFLLGYRLSYTGYSIFYITQGFIALPFVLIGYYFYKHKDNINFYLMFIISLIVFLFSFFIWKPIINLSVLTLPDNPIHYLIVSLSGSYMVISAVFLLVRLDWLKYIGRVLSSLGVMSLFIMALHGGVEPFVRPIHSFINNNWAYSITATCIQVVFSYYIGLCLKNNVPRLFSYK